MFEETRDFWEKELEGINMDGFDTTPKSKLCPTDIKNIRQRYEALSGREREEGISVSGHIQIKADITEFSRSLGATEEEIEQDILPSLGL